MQSEADGGGEKTEADINKGDRSGDKNKNTGNRIMFSEKQSIKDRKSQSVRTIKIPAKNNLKIKIDQINHRKNRRTLSYKRVSKKDHLLSPEHLRITQKQTERGIKAVLLKIKVDQERSG